MLFLLLGGPVAGFAYKAVNTMDSMLGYKNEKYMYFGRAAAPPGRQWPTSFPPALAALGHDCSLPACAAWMPQGIPDLETGSVLPCQLQFGADGVGMRQARWAWRWQEMRFILGKPLKTLYQGTPAAAWRRRISSEPTGFCTYPQGIIWLAGLLLRWTLCGGWGL